MRTICAWCPDFNPRDPANRGASHSICDRCRAAMNDDIRIAEQNRNRVLPILDGEIINDEKERKS